MVRGDTRNVWDGGQQYGDDGWPQLPSREKDVGWKHWLLPEFSLSLGLGALLREY